MWYSILRYILFFTLFGISFYAISAIQFDKFCQVRQPMKVTILMFLLSLILAYLSSQAILELTVFNGFGV